MNGPKWGSKGVDSSTQTCIEKLGSLSYMSRHGYWDSEHLHPHSKSL